jgi:hypothetical protein
MLIAGLRRSLDVMLIAPLLCTTQLQRRLVQMLGNEWSVVDDLIDASMRLYEYSD